MTTKFTRLFVVASALLLTAGVAVDAQAQCCGGGGYASHYGGYTAGYAPAAYQPSYGGWYPGYWWDRISARVWGSPGYVASYPTYTAAYRPAYYANYATTAYYAPTSYAAPACSSCSSCSSYAPACSTCASPCTSCSGYAPSESCSSCSSCAAAPVTTQAAYQMAQPTYQQPAYQQPSYQQPSGCATCGANAPPQSTTAVAPPQTYSSPQPTLAAPSTPTQQQPSTSTEPQPSLNDQNGDRTYREYPSNQTPPVQPGPASESETEDPYKINKGDSSTYFEAPKLFNPKDRTAQRSIAPVRTALYEQATSYRQTSTARGPITAEQAELDAAGWTTAAH